MHLHPSPVHALADFPDSFLLPQKGTLRGFELHGSSARANPDRKYDIEVPFRPFPLRAPDEPNVARIIRTALRIDEVPLDVAHAGQLQDRVLAFPINPADGYLESWICLHGRRNVVDVAEIAFGRFDGHAIAARMKLFILFEYEGSGFRNRAATIETVLELV